MATRIARNTGRLTVTVVASTNGEIVQGAVSNSVKYQPEEGQLSFRLAGTPLRDIGDLTSATTSGPRRSVR